MFLANSVCLRGQIAADILGQLLAQDQNRIERRAQLMAHVCQELRLVLRGERELGGLLFERAACLLDFGVLAFHLDVLLGQLMRLLLERFVGLLQLGLACLQLAGEALRLHQQPFGAHRGLDGVEHHPDRLRELLEERQVDVA